MRQREFAEHFAASAISLLVAATDHPMLLEQ